MTTAARPTFAPARGGTGKGEKDLSSLSKQYSSRDLPSHKQLKYRQTGQHTSEELRSRDFRRELEERERSAREKRSGRDRESTKRPRLDQIPASNLDADDPIDDEEAESDSDDDDDDDDTAVLLAELNKIKKERAQEQAKRDAEKAVEDERIRMENIIKGNPLLNQQEKQSQAAPPTTTDFKVKRRWDDDVVFKNCAKGEEEIQKGKGYINDSLRSEFHKKFMEKYIK